MTQDLPEEYVPFKTVVFCSNEMVDGHVLIEFGGVPIFLVGKNERTKHWLYLPTRLDEKNGPSDWQCVIENNEIRDGRAKLLVSENSSGMFWNNEQLVHIVAFPDKDTVEVPKIDLRPIGLDIQGDVNGVRFGTNQVIGNRMAGVRAMINLG